jgi:hypothetical protein
MLVWHPIVEKARIDRRSILDVLDTIPDVKNWRAHVGAILIASDSTAENLFRKIHEKLPTLIFLIAPIEIEEVFGWTDQDTWEFISEPKPAA